MSWDDMNRELGYQRIADLHADAERYRQVRLSRRRRQRRSRGRLGWLWPSGVAARAHANVGRVLQPAGAGAPPPPGPLAWLWPSGGPARPTAIVGGIFTPPWLSRRDQAGRPGWSARA